MASMMVSDNRAVGQVGTTIGLGLLFDTLVVRSFLMPSTAALLGRWFWWPMNVPSRPPRISRQTATAGAAHEQPVQTDVTAPLATVGNGTRHKRALHR
jgi:RND superfamily putative drug exporter